MTGAPGHEKVLHEKPDGTKLVRFECVDGSFVYGVTMYGDIVFLGTKAEAKKRYGTRRPG